MSDRSELIEHIKSGVIRKIYTGESISNRIVFS